MSLLGAKACGLDIAKRASRFGQSPAGQKSVVTSLERLGDTAAHDVLHRTLNTHVFGNLDVDPATGALPFCCLHPLGGPTNNNNNSNKNSSNKTKSVVAGGAGGSCVLWVGLGCGGKAVLVDFAKKAGGVRFVANSSEGRQWIKEWANAAAQAGRSTAVLMSGRCVNLDHPR
jgi:hypothetical protein